MVQVHAEVEFSCRFQINLKLKKIQFCRRVYNNPIIHTGSFTTRALEKKRKQEIAFGCVILKKKIYNLKDIREKTT
jgi:hypothetical protein